MLLDTTAGGGTVPTVTDNAFAQGLLASKEVGISFAPTTSTSDPNGQLTFGGVDTSKFIGPLTTVFVDFALFVAGALTASQPYYFDLPFKRIRRYRPKYNIRFRKYTRPCFDCRYC